MNRGVQIFDCYYSFPVKVPTKILWNNLMRLLFKCLKKKLTLHKEWFHSEINHFMIFKDSIWNFSLTRFFRTEFIIVIKRKTFTKIYITVPRISQRAYNQICHHFVSLFIYKSCSARENTGTERGNVSDSGKIFEALYGTSVHLHITTAGQWLIVTFITIRSTVDPVACAVYCIFTHCSLTGHFNIRNTSCWWTFKDECSWVFMPHV